MRLYKEKKNSSLLKMASSLNLGITSDWSNVSKSLKRVDAEEVVRNLYNDAVIRKDKQNNQ